MKSLLLLLCYTCLSWQCVQAQSAKRAFFIGNSYTYFNTLPNLINQIASTHGDTLIHASSTPGGAQLVQHVTNNNTLNGIRQGNWDFVIIQEQSQKPSFSDAQVATDVYPYAAELNDSIEFYNPCAETVFYMTWGRKNGDANNCPFLPALCTFGGMNARLRRAYLQMAADNQAITSPVGAVWRAMRDSMPGVDLYTPDESHPSYAGSYLAACTFYATLFKKPLTGTTFYGSLAPSAAQKIHELVDLVVLDSLSNWYIGAYDVQANFVATVGNDTAYLTNTSTYAQSYQWDFGDGSPLSTQANPSHQYNQAGNYWIELIAIDSCGKTDTIQQNISVGFTNTPTMNPDNELIITISPNPASDRLCIQSNKPLNLIKMLNSTGIEVFSQKNMKTSENVLYLDICTRGVYFLYFEAPNSQPVLKKLVLQ